MVLAVLPGLLAALELPVTTLVSFLWLTLPSLSLFGVVAVLLVAVFLGLVVAACLRVLVVCLPGFVEFDLLDWPPAAFFYHLAS